jgi:triacylglycerol lipase
MTSRTRAVLGCLALFGSVLAGCGGAPESEAAGSDQASTVSTVSSDASKKDAGASKDSGAADAGAAGGQATADFRAWLAANGYGAYNFPRDDVKGGSFGGKSSASESLTHTPIVFVHGNADSALGTGYIAEGETTSLFTGFSASVAYFTAHGYSMAELYGTTWGPADANQTANQEHSRAVIGSTRAFLEAVMAYTGSDKVDVISHSMGVTIARGAIYGGTQVDNEGSYSVGASLGSSVDTFIGISGANQGLAVCFDPLYTSYATCTAKGGFYPGVLDVFGEVDGLAKYLTNLHAKAGAEGSYRFAMFSLIDEIIGGGDLVYGQYTSRLEDETGELTYDTYGYGHVGVKDLTGAAQYSLVTKHTASGLTKP